ncbi:MAG: nicotinate phosphoribosyltransferase [Chlamydiia bacterium]|nr:nicotinate phosphoribosyltransferase [Chlamydiia bacterium]
MIYGYWKSGLWKKQAIFHLHFRKWPFQGGFAIAAGLETAISFLEALRFSDSDLGYLRTLQDGNGKPLYEEEFLHFLAQFQFECDIDALPEGTAVFPHEPLIRVKGPIWQGQLLESPLLNLINFQTLIATKSARICLAAHPDPVIEFGMRRAQGVDGAISASRAAFIGGCVGSSDVIAGKLFGIPVKGTHAHSWVMAFDEEIEAFTAFAKIMPKNCILLVDTYDSIRGVERAIQVAKSLKPQGFELSGIRLDSGDLARLSIEIRNILDREGFAQTLIMASNELDEYLIRDLKQQGAKITLWGVGTHLVTGKEQPALDGIYKLSAIETEEGHFVHRIKLSEQTAKVTNPGSLQIRRFFEGDRFLGDAIWDELLPVEKPFGAIDIQDPAAMRVFSGVGKDLLVPIYRKGKLVYHIPSLTSVQRHAKEECMRLSPQMIRLTNPELYFVGLEQGLYKKKLELIQQLRGKK